ncbi:MAG TPA: hypothetical protein VFU22_31655 [Roseiflexaceae bacterium]|nr:hypothetical protein [Roseiflexaceae bacterium]
MSALQARANYWRERGRRTAYAIGYATVEDPRGATHLHLWLGQQWSGARLYLIDLDSHRPGQDAGAALAAFRTERPELAARLDWHLSASGTGYHALFESHRQIETGKLYDATGNHIGELLGKDTDRTIDPGDVDIPCLHIGEIERLQSVWYVKGSDPKGERWADRAKQGLRWVRGYTRIHITKAELRAHLRRNCGWRGAEADALFDQHERFDRSAKFGSLVQTLMLHAHRIPGQQQGGFVERCAAVMAYAMAADAYGKAGEKGYHQEKDTASLIAQIVNEDHYGDGRQWKAPFWTKSQIAGAPDPEPDPEPKRAAHRPKGDQEKHLATFRRVLEAIEPDELGRRRYTLDYLAERMTAAHCPVKPRTIQAYLKTLRGGDGGGEIVTAQIDGNGRPYAILTSRFGGANKPPNTPAPAPKMPALGGANESAPERTVTPQSAETPLQCIEDHQNPGAPTAEPDEWAGIDEEIAAWKRGTAEGRHFSRLERRWQADADWLDQLRGTLYPEVRELVSQARALAKQVDDPGWWQRDYATMASRALLAEIRRLSGLAPPAGAQRLGASPRDLLGGAYVG